MGKLSMFTAVGWSLPFFGKGRSALLAKNHNDVIRALNALGKLQIKRDPNATEDRFLYAADNIVLMLAGQAGGGGTSGPISWFYGDWTSATVYPAQVAVRYSGVGMFVSLQVVPANTPPDTGSPYWVKWYDPTPGVWGF